MRSTRGFESINMNSATDQPLRAAGCAQRDHCRSYGLMAEDILPARKRFMFRIPRRECSHTRNHSGSRFSGTFSRLERGTT